MVLIRSACAVLVIYCFIFLLTQQHVINDTSYLLAANIHGLWNRNESAPAVSGNNQLWIKSSQVMPTNQVISSRKIYELETQRKRLQQLRDFCKADKRNRLPQEELHMVIVKSLRVVYCEIGKVSSTAWRLIIKKLIGDNSWGRNSLHFRSMIKKMVEISRRYFKFLFVRHPYDRLISAYFDKFQHDSEYTNTLTPFIISRYRENATLHHQANRDVTNSSTALKVTFQEFIKYIVDPRNAPLKDFHWSPQSKLCPLCLKKFDFIGHHETFNEDAIYVINRLSRNMTTTVKLDRSGWGPPTYNEIMKRIKKMFSLLTRSQIDFLEKMYESDFKAFGYPPIRL